MLAEAGCQIPPHSSFVIRHSSLTRASPRPHRNRPARSTGARGDHRARLEEHHEPRAKVIETGDPLEVFPSPLHGATIETCHDHRLAMCFAILGLKVPGLKLRNPACVKKTFPNFFQKLAAPPPHGLGVEIRDGRTGRKLGPDELFAG